MSKKRDKTPHIGIYGRRNNGKSSLINAVAGQDIAIVSDTPGTTTDPVKKSFEITGFGPVILVDTAGIDDEGDLGLKRIHKTVRTIDTVDMAILLITEDKWGNFEDELTQRFNDQDIPFIVVAGKSDLSSLSTVSKQLIKQKTGKDIVSFSVYDKEFS
jgi:small GTP-binding protein